MTTQYRANDRSVAPVSIDIVPSIGILSALDAVDQMASDGQGEGAGTTWSNIHKPGTISAMSAAGRMLRHNLSMAPKRELKARRIRATAIMAQPKPVAPSARTALNATAKATKIAEK